MLKLFFSYSHVDEPLRKELGAHLRMLERSGLVSPWHDRKLLAGDEFDKKIAAELAEADVILLLVSASFLDSFYCYEVEMTQAVERHEAGAARVIPVILRDCDWHSAPFGKLVAVPTDGKPVTSWNNRDEALADAVRQIRRAVEEMATRSSGANSAPAAPTARPMARRAPVSAPSAAGNAAARPKLKRAPTQLDKDDYLRDAFEQLASRFEELLRHLEADNEGVAQRFTRVDAHTFTVTIYRDGKQVRGFTARLGGVFGSGITYSWDANAGPGTCNGVLTVEADNEGLHLNDGMSFTRDKARLTQQEAVARLWEELLSLT